MHFAQLVTPNGLLLLVGGRRFTVANDHPNRLKIDAAIADKRYSDIENLVDTTAAVRQWLDSSNEFSLENSVLVYQNRPFSFAITEKVLKMMEAGQQPEPLFNFLRKVRKNPSKTAQDELLLFMVANEFMIHEDGDILAYKSVRGDYTDIHSGKVLNKVGTYPPPMDRSQVDDRRDVTCSFGYHFASYHYATTWHHRSDARLLIMKIDPADVVTVPSDYNNQKARCCKYFVLAEIPHAGSKLPPKEVYTNDDFDFDYDDEDEGGLFEDDDYCDQCGRDCNCL